METRDGRPNLVGVMKLTPKTGPATTYNIKADTWGTYGTYQTRTVEKGFKPPILPIRYGFVPALRAAEFHKVVVEERSGQPPSYAKVANYDGVGSTYEVWMNHLWTVPMQMSTLAEKVLPAISPAEYSYANTMALSRVSLAGWEAGVDLAELPETYMFLRKPFGSMENALTKFDRRVKINYDRNVRSSAAKFHTRQQKRFDYAEAIMGTWLVGRYAVTPLVRSTLDAAETAAGKFQDLMRVYTAKGGKTVVLPMSETTAGSSFPSSWPSPRGGLTQRVIEMGERKCSVVIRFRPTTVNPDIVELARWGLTPTMLLSMIHEATPFSFMFDWVTNLGQWIKACQPKPELQILDACRTDTWKYTFAIDSTKCGAGYVPNGSITGGRGVMRRNDMKRSIITRTMTAPSLHFRGGGVRLLQAIDAASIASQILLPKLKPFADALSNAAVWDRLRRKGLTSWEQSLLQFLEARPYPLVVGLR